MELQVWRLRVQITERAQDGGRMEFGTKASAKSRFVVREKPWVPGQVTQINCMAVSKGPAPFCFSAFQA